MIDSDDVQHMFTAWEGRLSAIENDQTTIKGQLSDLQQTIGRLEKADSALSTSVKSMAETLQQLAQNQAINQKTNWNVVFAGLTVALLFGGLVIYEPLNKLEDEFQNHVSDGHPTSVLNRIQADERSMEQRLDRKQSQLMKIEERIDAYSTKQSSIIERMLNLERDMYIGAQYRAGRPSKTTKADNGQ